MRETGERSDPISNSQWSASDILVLSNPPYGERLAGGELDLYDDMARWCEQFPGNRAAFLVGNPQFEEVFGLRARIRKPISNGALRAYFCLYDL
jgi:23S rRNA G2445 N2-methylase RlmL